MYLRRCHRAKDGKRHAYWALVKSVRTARGPRQQVVAYLGDLDEAGRLGMRQAAEGTGNEPSLFEEGASPRYVEVDVANVRVENTRQFGGPWLGMQIIRKLGLVELLEKLMPPGREEVPWPMMSLVLVLCRLCDPSSELHIAEHYFEQSALAEVLGVPDEKVNDDRLYRALDRLLPHKEALEIHLKNRLGELFDLKYDLLLYDMTSTYFEGQAEGNELAKRGYSRDCRPQCKQVCIALVVSRCGMPLGYEVFAGNRADVTTVKEIVQTMEKRYGQADRIWAMDRGMVSEANIEFLKEGGRRYIVGTPKSMLRKYEQSLLSGDWKSIRDGLEVKLVAAPAETSAAEDPGAPSAQAMKPGSQEVFILCRSADRREKERAIHARFEKRIEEGLESIVKMCGRRKLSATDVAHRVGKLLGRNTRAAGLFKTEVTAADGQARQDATGWASLSWTKVESWRSWSQLSEGCYLLRSNVTDWSAEELWRAYMQLSEAEGAFRIHKTDLELRPVWHQKEDRVKAHILVCFLAYVLRKTLGAMCGSAGLGDEPRKAMDDLSKIMMVDVVMPTRCGREIRRRCVAKPTEHQAILLHRLGLALPRSLEMEM